MAGLSIETDNKLRNYIEKILEQKLEQEYGLVKQEKMTYEQAEKIFLKEMAEAERDAEINGWFSHEDVWRELGL